MNKILITAGTSALAFRLKNNLSNQFTFVLGESDEIPSVLKNQYIQTPKDSSPSFVHEILKIALDNNINKVIPLRDTEIIKLSKSLTIFEEYGISILIPESATLSDIKTLSNPDKSIPLSLLDHGTDLISGNKTNLEMSGLVSISDEGNDFILILA